VSVPFAIVILKTGIELCDIFIWSQFGKIFKSYFE
jgi:hypothetical protein